MVILVLLCCFPCKCEAGISDNEKEQLEDLIKKAKNGTASEEEKRTIISLMKEEYPSFEVAENQVKIIFGDFFEEEEKKALQVGTGTWVTGRKFPDVILGGYTLPTVSTVLGSVHESLTMFSLVLACIMFFVGLMSAALQQQAYEEVIFKRLVTLMVTIGMIAFSAMLVLNISNIGTGIMNMISNKLNSEEMLKNNEETMLNLETQICVQCYTDNGNHWYNDIFDPLITAMCLVGYNAMLVPAWLGSCVAFVVVSVICYGRAVEIYIMAAMSPLAICDISSGQGMGMTNTSRFIKNVCAISLQGAIIVLSMFICKSIQIGILADMNGTFSDFWATSWSLVVMCFVQIGLASKSLKVSKDIIGV